MTEVKERIGYIDFFRGFGIIMMIMGHIGFGGEFNHWIHGFHMPMFFFISGYLYKTRVVSWRIFIKHKIQTLLLPYVVFGITQFILWRIIKGDSWKPLMHLLWENTDGLAICGALWFLTSLFFTLIICEILYTYIHNCHLLNVMVLIICIVGCIWNSFISFRLPWGIDAAMVGVGFYHLGKVLKDKKPDIANNWLWIIFIIINISIIISPDINLRTGKYGIFPIFYINAATFSYVGLELCKKVYANLMGIKVGSWLCEVGKNSIIYVCLNQLIITILDTCVIRITTIPIIKGFLILIISVLLLSFISRIINITKLRRFIGK